MAVTRNPVTGKMEGGNAPNAIKGTAKGEVPKEVVPPDQADFDEYRKSPEGGFAAQRGPKFEAWKEKRKKKMAPPPATTPGLTDIKK